MLQEAVLVFDIGKTNKKVLLFNKKLELLHEEETVFPEIKDEDDFLMDDIEKIESWIMNETLKFVQDPGYNIVGVNFTTYGATLVYLDEKGKRIGPAYNYLKQMPGGLVEQVYDKYGGEQEFCRNTASPALGMLNSGFQALWLKETKADFFAKVKTILHLPQYLAYLLSGKICSEHTSIGCHTALWDFDHMTYHPWVGELNKTFPEPVPAETTFKVDLKGRDVFIGVGIHDSSASLVPYFMKSEEPFILVSTGTWCISMNPFNDEALTAEQLNKDCLSYMSIQQKAVKSSRLFMGRIHDVNVERLNKLFKVDADAYKKVKLDVEMLDKLVAKNTRIFFKKGVPENYVDLSIEKADFNGFEEAYHQLMLDLGALTVDAIKLILPEMDQSRQVYVSGGFSKNPIFLHILEKEFPQKKVASSEIANATSLGAALVLWKGIDKGFEPSEYIRI